MQSISNRNRYAGNTLRVNYHYYYYLLIVLSLSPHSIYRMQIIQELGPFCMYDLQLYFQNTEYTAGSFNYLLNS